MITIKYQKNTCFSNSINSMHCKSWAKMDVKTHYNFRGFFLFDIYFFSHFKNSKHFQLFTTMVKLCIQSCFSVIKSHPPPLFFPNISPFFLIHQRIIVFAYAQNDAILSMHFPPIKNKANQHYNHKQYREQRGWKPASHVDLSKVLSSWLHWYKYSRFIYVVMIKLYYNVVNQGYLLG